MYQMAQDSWLNVSIYAESSPVSHQSKQLQAQAAKVQLIRTNRV